jgi:hypothetical protein
MGSPVPASRWRAKRRYSGGWVSRVKPRPHVKAGGTLDLGARRRRQWAADLLLQVRQVSRRHGRNLLGRDAVRLRERGWAVREVPQFAEPLPAAVRDAARSSLRQGSRSLERVASLASLAIQGFAVELRHRESERGCDAFDLGSLGRLLFVFEAAQFRATDPGLAGQPVKRLPREAAPSPDALPRSKRSGSRHIPLIPLYGIPVNWYIRPSTLRPSI